MLGSSFLVFQFLDRLRYFEERSHQQRENLIAQQCQEKSEKIEQCLASEYKLKVDGNEDDEMYNALQGMVFTLMIILFLLPFLYQQDVSLPAVFFPTKGKDLSIYNPRAHQYFHPTGGKIRNTCMLEYSVLYLS